MAEKRMISRVISISKKFNIRLDDHFSRLLYVLLIPHSDDFGRLTGDPFKIKALILPMMDDVSWEIVETSLIKLHNAELIIWYDSSGEKYIQINNFDDHQQGLHKRTRSKFPEPPNNSGKFREIPQKERTERTERTEEKETEQKELGVSVPTFDGDHKDQIRNLLKTYSVECKGVAQLEDISAYFGPLDIEVIEQCIKEAEGKHVPYAISIIQRRQREGKTKRESLHRIQIVPDRNREDPELARRHVEIARSKWIQDGGNPDEFVYNPPTGA